MEKLSQDYKERGVQVLIIDVMESKEVATSWVQRHKFSFPILLDPDGETAAKYAPPEVLPDLARHEVVIASNLIIDKEGIIQFLSLLDTQSFDAKLITLKKVLNRLLEEDEKSKTG